MKTPRWLEPIARLYPSSVTRLVGFSIMVGLVAGLGALLFSLALNAGTEFCIERVCGVRLPEEGKHLQSTLEQDSPSGVALRPAEASETYVFQPPPMRKRLWILVVPALGGLLCGLVVFTFAPEAEGHGTDSVVDAYHNNLGRIRRRIPVVKIIASTLTISTGGNAGREGPIAQVSAGFGSWLADVFHLSPRRRRMLVVAGIGAGVGSIFRSPLGGALFAVDVLYRDTEFEYEALIPSFIASIVGYTIYAQLTPAGMGPIFTIPPDLVAHSPLHLGLCVVLAAVLAVAGVAYVKVFYGVTDLFRNRIPIKRHFKPMLGGLILGGVAFVDPRLLGAGYGWVQQAINGNLTLAFICVLIVAKILLTAVTIGSGGSGGVFGPSIVIGGLIGGAFGTVCQKFVPDVQPAAFVLLGMGGFFAGAAKVPISTIIMVSEMTVGYSLLLPLMLVSSLTFLLSPHRISIYVKQVARRVDSPAHLGDFVVDILERMRVSDVLTRTQDIVTVEASTPLMPLLERVSQTRQSTYPVLDEEGRLESIIRLDDMRGAFMQPELASLIIAQDVGVQHCEPICTTDNLNEALRKISKARCDELPVVASPGSRRMIGMLSRHELVQAYSTGMESLMKPAGGTGDAGGGK